MFHTKRFVRHPTLPGKYKTVFHRKSSKKEKTPPFKTFCRKTPFLWRNLKTVFTAKSIEDNSSSSHSPKFCKLHKQGLFPEMVKLDNRQVHGNIVINLPVGKRRIPEKVGIRFINKVKQRLAHFGH